MPMVWTAGGSEAGRAANAKNQMLKKTTGVVATPTLGSIAAEAYGDLIHRFLLSRAPRSDVPDLVQQVFLKLLKVPYDDLIVNPEAFIIQSAKLVLLEHLRRERNRQKILCTDSDLVEQLSKSSQLADFDEPAHLVSSAEFFERFLNSLPAHHAAALVLHKRDGLTHEEVAAQLGVTTRAVRRYLIKARAQLARALADGYGTPRGSEPYE